jgi:hypothetical protein
MRKASLFIFLLVFAGACRQRCDCVVPYEVYYFKGVVVNTSVSGCNLPIIDFTEDSIRIKSLTGTDNVYCIAKGLDAGFMTQGKKVYVNVHKLSPDHDFACPMSADFSHIGIIDTKPRN